MWLKKIQKDKLLCYRKKNQVMTLQTTLLKFFSLSHQKPRNNLSLSRSSGTCRSTRQGLQTLALPLPCCSLRATSTGFLQQKQHPGAREPEALPLLVLLKCRCTFRCKPPLFFFWSVSSLCSSCKCDFCLFFFF